MNPYFLIFEILIYVLFIICLMHARNQGLLAILRLFSGAIFGVLLEWATIKQLDAYCYGRFLIMVDNVPLAIGVAWSVIIYGSMLYSNGFNLPGWAKCIFNGLLALCIDLSMDAIAIRLGMWNWGMGMKFEYFGVPYANFWAWF